MYAFAAYPLLGGEIGHGACMDWFKGIVQGDAASRLQLRRQHRARSGEDKGAELAGLNFKTAIDAHLKWKVRLESYINGTSTEQLNVARGFARRPMSAGQVDLRQGRREVRFFRDLLRHEGPPCPFPSLCRGRAGGGAGRATRPLPPSCCTAATTCKASERVKMLLARMFMIASEGKEAIDAHLMWKKRLQAYINGESKEDLKVEIVSGDDQCYPRPLAQRHRRRALRPDAGVRGGQVAPLPISIAAPAKCWPSPSRGTRRRPCTCWRKAPTPTPRTRWRRRSSISSSSRRPPAEAAGVARERRTLPRS